MENILRQGTQPSNGSEGAAPAADADEQSAAAGSAMLSPMHYASFVTPAGGQTGDMISLGQRIMPVVMLIGPLLLMGIYAFFRHQPRLIRIIEGLEFSVLPVL
ncbi:hypothetical protein [Arthrobacter mangrovi]|nr:hypothetical protein [Arthrobacter mangrovi]